MRPTRHRTITGAIPALAVTLVLLAACGGRQEALAPPPEPPPPPTCLPERWEQPPRDIGQIPPDREAPRDALDVFRPAPAAEDPIPEEPDEEADESRP